MAQGLPFGRDHRYRWLDLSNYELRALEGGIVAYSGTRLMARGPPWL